MTNVLIIEDEAELLDEMVMMLRFEGFEVTGTTDGAEGVRLAYDTVPDIIVSDIMLPLLDGYGVFQALQGNPATQHIPFIFLTAKSDNVHLRQGMTLGADDYITKPFTRDELLEAIQVRLAEREIVAQVYQNKLDDLRRSLSLTLPHEFRTPLTSLVGFTELLATDYQELNTSQIADMADVILMAGKRLKRHLENFWLYAQLEALKASPAGQIMLQDDHLTRPGEVIALLVQRLASDAEREHDLVLRIDDAPLSISAESFGKIVDELVSNAFKFSTSGTVVRVEAFPNGDRYSLRVSDKGRGMLPEQIKEAGAYIQYERALFEQQGIGLGLAIVREIVRLQGGELTITSQPGQGTDVLVTLPLDTGEVKNEAGT